MRVKNILGRDYFRKIFCTLNICKIQSNLYWWKSKNILPFPKQQNYPVIRKKKKTFNVTWQKSVHQAVYLMSLYIVNPKYFFLYSFSNSLIIHEEKTREITTVKEVWICDPNYHKIRRSFALIFSKNYQCFEKLYQTLERVFHQISKHFEAG